MLAIIIFLDHLNDSSGIKVYQSCKNNEIQGYFELWDKTISLFRHEFVIQGGPKNGMAYFR